MRKTGGLILAAALAAATVPAAAREMRAEGRAVVERTLRESARWPIFDALQHHYPERYQRLLSNLAKKNRPANQIVAHATMATEAFANSRADSFRAAPTDKILAFHNLKLSIVGSFLKENAPLCAGMLNGTTAYKVEKAQEGRMAQLTTAAIELKAAGEGRPIPAGRKTLSGADIDALAGIGAKMFFEMTKPVATGSRPFVRLMVKQVNGGDEQASADSETLEAMQCSMMLQMLDIRALPPEQAANIAAYIDFMPPANKGKLGG